MLKKNGSTAQVGGEKRTPMRMKGHRWRIKGTPTKHPFAEIASDQAHTCPLTETGFSEVKGETTGSSKRRTELKFGVCHQGPLWTWWPICTCVPMGIWKDYVRKCRCEPCTKCSRNEKYCLFCFHQQDNIGKKPPVRENKHMQGDWRLALAI